MTSLHEVAPTLRSDLDALVSLSPESKRDADMLEAEYLGVVRKHPRQHGDTKFIVLTEGCACPFRLKLMEGLHIAAFTLDQDSTNALQHFTSLGEMVNDKYERIGRGRPFRDFCQPTNPMDYGIKAPFLTFVIHRHGE